MSILHKSEREHDDLTFEQLIEQALLGQMSLLASTSTQAKDERASYLSCRRWINYSYLKPTLAQLDCKHSISSFSSIMFNISIYLIQYFHSSCSTFNQRVETGITNC